MSTRLSRREVLGLAVAAPLAAAVSVLGRSKNTLDKAAIARPPWKVIAAGNSTAVMKSQPRMPVLSV